MQSVPNYAAELYMPSVCYPSPSMDSWAFACEKAKEDAYHNAVYLAIHVAYGRYKGLTKDQQYIWLYEAPFTSYYNLYVQVIDAVYDIPEAVFLTEIKNLPYKIERICLDYWTDVYPKQNVNLGNDHARQ